MDLFTSEIHVLKEQFIGLRMEALRKDTLVYKLIAISQKQENYIWELYRYLDSLDVAEARLLACHSPLDNGIIVGHSLLTAFGGTQSPADGTSYQETLEASSPKKRSPMASAIGSHITDASPFRKKASEQNDQKSAFSVSAVKTAGHVMTAIAKMSKPIQERRESDDKTVSFKQPEGSRDIKRERKSSSNASQSQWLKYLSGENDKEEEEDEFQPPTLDLLNSQMGMASNPIEFAKRAKEENDQLKREIDIIKDFSRKCIEDLNAAVEEK